MSVKFPEIKEIQIQNNTKALNNSKNTVSVENTNENTVNMEDTNENTENYTENYENVNNNKTKYNLEDFLNLKNNNIPQHDQQVYEQSNNITKPPTGNSLLISTNDSSDNTSNILGLAFGLGSLLIFGSLK